MIVAHVWAGAWGLLAGFVWLAFWVVVILAVVSLVRSRPAAREGAASPALRLLEERYARGEISREDFLERRRVLHGGHGATT